MKEVNYSIKENLTSLSSNRFRIPFDEIVDGSFETYDGFVVSFEDRAQCRADYGWNHIFKLDDVQYKKVLETYIKTKEDISLLYCDKVMIKDNTIYTSYDSEKFTSITGVSNTMIKKVLRNMDIKFPNDENLICKCGNDSFKLKYGDYCVDGTCSVCGNEFGVYSG